MYQVMDFRAGTALVCLGAVRSLFSKLLLTLDVGVADGFTFEL